MDHQLADELNLDNAMGVEFEHGEEEIVSQSDVTLEGSDMEGMSMEFQHIEEQPMLMESGGEEIIDTESLIDEEYTLDAGNSYVVQDGKVIDTSLSDQLKTDTMMDIQFDHQTLATNSPATVTRSVIPIKSQRPLAVLPKQVAIAPKPPPLSTAAKHVAIAPKPVAITAVNRASGRMKTMSLSDVMQGQKAGHAFITQAGKQYVMMPAGSSGQKIKLVPAAGSSMAQLIATNKTVAAGHVTKKPMMAKVIVTSQANSLQSAEPSTVITGIGVNQTRYVQMQPKTIAFSLANKVMGSPTKHGIRFSKPKPHIVTVQSTSPKLVSASTKVGSGQKIVLADGTKSVVLKAAVPNKAQAAGQRTQIHQINVPGKGVQYIRLVTNPATAATTATTASSSAATERPPAVTRPARNIVFTDNKGNIIQMAAEKVLSGGQPPPLVVAGGASLSKVAGKPQQKLVKIAPVVAKASLTNTMQPARSGQSLLAPITPSAEEKPPSPSPPSSPSPPPAPSPDPSPEPEDSKAALRALIEDAVRDEPADMDDSNIQTHEVEVDFERLQSPVQEENDYKIADRHEKVNEHPLIVIPSNFEQREETNSNSRMDDSYGMTFMDINPDITAYQPPSPAAEEELGDRPRKACNCTKSQCLKLYCDCFANGEFCNRCNCTNCHNNLENEELRQKAIRGCLDRNPNAFRPKIGKSRVGGPETVRRHNKGCNCKRSGCLKNYCECYEAKIACTAICKCVGCRNVEMALERLRRREQPREPPAGILYRPPPALSLKQPCSFMTTEVIEAVCQCLLATGTENEVSQGRNVELVLLEFARCLQDIITASQQGPAMDPLDGSS